jgi:hypothetical protein
MGRSHRGKIAVCGVIRALLEIEPVDELRDDDVQVRVALSVGVGGQVHGHPVDIDREIRAVVEIEPAREVLVRLSAARMLGDDESGNGFEDFPIPQERPVFKLVDADRALGRRIGDTDQIVLPSLHHKVGQSRHGLVVARIERGKRGRRGRGRIRDHGLRIAVGKR